MMDSGGLVVFITWLPKLKLVADKSSSVRPEGTPLPYLCAWASLPPTSSGQSSRCRLSKDDRPPVTAGQFAALFARSPRTCPRIRPTGRHVESPFELPEVHDALERRPPRDPHPERSQGGVREVAITF